MERLSQQDARAIFWSKVGMDNAQRRVRFCQVYQAWESAKQAQLSAQKNGKGVELV